MGASLPQSATQAGVELTSAASIIVEDNGGIFMMITERSVRH
jgi:hypothetical protein